MGAFGAGDRETLYESNMIDNVNLKINACKLAKDLLESDSSYLDKVIELWRIGNSLYGQCWDTEFHIFGVIESDTDHLPTEKVRQHCSEYMLTKSDKELKTVIEFYKQDVIRACKEIILKHKSV